MGGDTGRLRQEIKWRLSEAGACAVGFAAAGPVGGDVMTAYDAWIARGDNAGMTYMANHREVRADARLLLEGAKTVISMAFAYAVEEKRDPGLPKISSYAYVPDYHKSIRRAVRDSRIGELLGEEHSDWRLCVDTAPIFERYWARQAGIAIIGLNGSAIVPGVGAQVFLAEIVTNIGIEPDQPLEKDCGSCRACIKACPTGALGEGMTIDCNRCLSYLTIEHRGEWTDKRHLQAMSTGAGRRTLFGCDRCIEACPHNQAAGNMKPIGEVLRYAGGPLPEGSSLRRAKAEGIERNLRNIKGES